METFLFVFDAVVIANESERRDAILLDTETSLSMGLSVGPIA